MSIRKNLFYSVVLTTSNYVFPLLVYPYISRVLGVNGIGICNFADSIINYFVLFSTIGISIIGIREIASVKDNNKELDIVFTSLIVHTIIPTLIACIAFVLAVFYIEKLGEYKEILLIGIGKLLGTAFLLDWFFKGMENFKYITKCTIVIKVLYVISVFAFVKEPEDYLIYFLLTTIMVLVNSLYNIFYCRHFVRIKFSRINCIQLIKPNLINGLYLFLNTMYITLNVAFLGFVSNVTQVGYYTTSSKIFAIILAMYSAFTGVMLPRMSYLYSEERMDEFKELINKSLNVLIIFTIPVVLVCTILSPQIIDVISGPGYEGAYIPAAISMPLIFVVGYEQILIIQILTPLKEDSIKLKNSIVGAIVGVVGNIVLVKTFLAVGATIVWALSEISVLITAQYFVSKLIGLRFPFAQLIKEILLYLPLCLLIVYLRFYTDNPLLILGMASILSFMYFLVLKLFLQKDKIVLGTAHSLFKYFR